MGFLRQEYWSGLPFSSLGDLPNLEMEPESPALHVGFLPLSHLGNPFRSVVVAVQLLSHVRLFVTLWTAALELLCPRDFSGKNTGVGCHFLL